MKRYKYEMHCHTAEGSRCSVLAAKDAVRYYKDLGYDGVFVTDHFTGNTTVPKDTPWRERVKLFYQNGYAIAKEEGDKIGIKVFWAPEYSMQGNDFLFVGIGPEWFAEQDDFFSLTPNAQLDRIHEGGGFIIHAHPFAQDVWIPCIRLFPDKEDAVEVFNGGGTAEIAERAIWYARSYGLPMTGGSDTHSVDQKNLCGIETERECFTARDVIECIKDGSAKPFSNLHNDLLRKVGKEEI